MENLTVNATLQEVETQDKATTRNWRADERRTDNRILSALVRNAERKHKAMLANKSPESDLK